MGHSSPPNCAPDYDSRLRRDDDLALGPCLCLTETSDRPESLHSSSYRPQDAACRSRNSKADRDEPLPPFEEPVKTDGHPDASGGLARSIYVTGMFVLYCFINDGAAEEVVTHPITWNYLLALPPRRKRQCTAYSFRPSVRLSDPEHMLHTWI